MVESVGHGIDPLSAGLSIRVIRPTDNEAVRDLFAVAQLEMLREDDPPEAAQLVNGFIDRVLAGDLANPSSYYSEPGRRLWVVDGPDGALAGMLAVDRTEDPEMGEIFRMVVSPERRRKGLAKLLLRIAERWAVEHGYRRLTLDTTERHLNAMKLYQSSGFVQVGERSIGPIRVLRFEKSL